MVNGVCPIKKPVIGASCQGVLGFPSFDPQWQHGWEASYQPTYAEFALRVVTLGVVRQSRAVVGVASLQHGHAHMTSMRRGWNLPPDPDASDVFEAGRPSMMFSAVFFGRATAQELGRRLPGNPLAGPPASFDAAESRDRRAVAFPA